LKGWTADYDDPLSFADLFASWNLNNNGRYSNPDLDAEVRLAQQSLDPHVRFGAFAEIQRILIEDAVLVMSFERGVLFVQDRRLKNVVHRAVGPYVDYSYAYLVDTP
jgi:oligopeptide transport system substrate-binding protein